MKNNATFILLMRFNFRIYEMYVDDEYQEMIAVKVAKIKTKFWFGVVLYYAGATNPNNLDKKLHILKHGSDKSYEPQSMIWYRYENAQDIPSFRTINRVNQLLPQTSYYYNHPFWSILNYDSYSFLDITQKIAHLEVGVMGRVLYLEEIGGTILRRYPTTKKLLNDIEHGNPFDVLMVSLLLYSEVIDQNQSKRYYILNFVEQYIKKMKLSPEFKLVEDIVFEFLSNFYRSLELKNELNFIHKEDYALYQKISSVSSKNYTYRDIYEATIAFNKIRDFYD